MNRAGAIDVLRCLAIAGMVLSGQIVFHADLPAWLFHGQTPPPDFAFDPSVAGITWVDLVFPFFLFSMGAAFPLALRRRMERGAGVVELGLGLLKRWFLLALFAVALANTRMATVAQITASDTLRGLILVGTWGLFFCMLARVPGMNARRNDILNWLGVAAVIVLMVFYRHGLGLEAVSVQRSDVIILVLSTMALFGGAVWWASRDNILLRLGILAGVVALRLAAGAEGSWVGTLWNWSPAPWLFRFDYLKYLCIVIPGTIAGDAIYRWMKGAKSEADAGVQPSRPSRPSRSRAVAWATVLAVAMFVLVMWALFARQMVVGTLGAVLLGGAALGLLRRDRSETGRMHLTIFAWGFAWLLLGLVLEACEGGIKKDPATYSYFFTTAGLASTATVVISMLISCFGVKMGFLARCGRNPMIAYTASGYATVPLLMVVQAAPLLEALGGAGAWWGVARGVVVTALMMIFTVAFTRKQIYWRT